MGANRLWHFDVDIIDEINICTFVDQVLDGHVIQIVAKSDTL